MQHVQSLFEFFLGTLKTMKQKVKLKIDFYTKKINFDIFRMKI
jgi:hypothetical protein